MTTTEPSGTTKEPQSRLRTTNRVNLMNAFATLPNDGSQSLSESSSTSQSVSQSLSNSENISESLSTTLSASSSASTSNSISQSMTTPSAETDLIDKFKQMM